MARIADSPSTVSSAHVNDPVATPMASAMPDARLTLIEVPMTARMFGPGLAMARRKAE